MVINRFFAVFSFSFLITFSCLHAYQRHEIDTLMPYVENAKNIQDSLDWMLVVCDYYSQYDLEKGIRYADTIMNVSMRVNDSASLCHAYHYAAICRDLLGRYDQALEYYQKSYDILEALGDTRLCAGALVNISIIHKNTGKLDLAVEYLKRVHQLALDNDWPGLEVNSYINIGNAYLEYNKISKAAEYFKKANQLSEKIGDSQTKGKALVNLAIIHWHRKEYHKAMDSLQIAFSIFNDSDNIEGQLITLNNIAELYTKLNKIDSSKKYLKMGLAIASKYDNKSTILHMNNTFGELLSMEGRYVEAIIKYNKALNMAISINSVHDIRSTFGSIIDMYKRKGDYKKATEFLEKQISLNDSLFSDKNLNKLAELEADLETQKKTHEIQMLKAESELQEARVEQATITRNLAIIIMFLLVILAFVLFRFYRRQRDTARELSELVATKDKFFSIIAHDLKNPIGSYNLATEMLTDSFYDLDEDEKKEMLDELRRSSGNLAKLLDNLLIWSRSQQGRIEYNPEKCDIRQIASYTVEQLSSQADAKQVKFSNCIESSIHAFFDSNITMTILRNLASNAIKYTPRGGKVEIRAVANDDFITVSVSDTGMGMNEETLKNLFGLDIRASVPGTCGETGTGLGLIVCREFAELQGGRIWAESQPGHGSRFSFTVRASQSANSKESPITLYITKK